MNDREGRLNKLVLGDIFHAQSPNGASLICLVTEVTQNNIRARAVTTQNYFVFDRRTGIAECDNFLCTIDSVAPLPIEIHNAFLGLDRKMRLEHNVEKIKLTNSEKAALLYADELYPSNPM
jgi:hypothetical protein